MPRAFHILPPRARCTSIWSSGLRLRSFARRLSNRLGSSEGSEIVEFAVCLPLLVVFLIGTIDFGNAFTLRQKINGAAMEGARVAANQPSSDLSSAGTSCATAASICAIRDAVDGSLVVSKVADCGLSTAAPAFSAPLTWTFTAACPAALTLVINRGYTYSTAVSGNPYTVEASSVSLTYPYRWQFYRAIILLVPSAVYPSLSEFTSVAVMQNLD